MKKNHIISQILFIVLSMSFVSCEKLEKNVKEYFGVDTEEEKKEEQVDAQTKMFRNVEKITQTAGEIYMKSSSVSEMKTNISNNLNMDGIESVWSDDLTVFVKIKDFGTIPYVFTPADSESSFATRSEDDKVGTRTTLGDQKIHSHQDLRSVCIVNQQANDESRNWEKMYVKYMDEDFSKCGFYVTVNNRPNIQFFAEGMFGYDLLYINTPGCYDDRAGLHWLFTGEEVITSETVDVNTLQYITQYNLKDYPAGMVGIGALKETRSGKEQIVYYLIVSEKLIAKGSNQQFEKPALVFNSACQSVKTNTELAKAFIQKNAAVYLGYNEKNSVGKFAGAEFCSRLLMGMSVGFLFENFPEQYLSETIDGVTANLKLYYNERIGESYTMFCVVHPELERVDNSSTEDEIKVTLQGGMKTPDGYNTDVLSYFTYGFCIGETPNFKEAKVLDGLHIGDAGLSYSNNRITFQKTLGDNDLKSSTEYYCWAYYYDGVNYCVSDSMTFTTPYRPAPSIEEIVTPEYMQYVHVIRETDTVFIERTIKEYVEKKIIIIVEGEYPPDIQGTYLMSPDILVYSTYGYDPGDKFADKYIRFFNQKRSRISYESLQKGSNSVSYGQGGGVVDVYVTGFGEYFTVYLRTESINSYSDSDVYSVTVDILTGRMTERGIEDLQTCFLMLDKGSDPFGHIVPIGTYRKFYDGDGLSESTTWPSLSRTRSTNQLDKVIRAPWTEYSTGK